MPWRMHTPPFSRARFSHLWGEWRRSVGFFCLILTFFDGCILMLDILFPTVPSSSLFHIWGEGGIFVLGLIFVGISVWEGLIAQGDGYEATVIVLCGVGIVSALHPLSIVGIGFYALAFGSVFGERLFGPVAAVFAPVMRPLVAFAHWPWRQWRAWRDRGRR